jgi:hypothetical protein
MGCSIMIRTRVIHLSDTSRRRVLELSPRPMIHSPPRQLPGRVVNVVT